MTSTDFSFYITQVLHLVVFQYPYAISRSFVKRNWSNFLLVRPEKSIVVDPMSSMDITVTKRLPRKLSLPMDGSKRSCSVSTFSSFLLDIT